MNILSEATNWSVNLQLSIKLLEVPFMILGDIYTGHSGYDSKITIVASSQVTSLSFKQV